MDKYAVYLRKSRADEELEKTLGEGETLARHRKALLRYAKENNLNIVSIKEEVVSGESLFNRPMMIELLKEVENKQYDGVLVMDMQRLGRGDMQDQGIILKTFKESNTKIITPQKTYDLSNDFDEEYSEFEAFMSRKELKMINRRMQGGRVRSIEEGNYIATNPPLGYDIELNGRTRTLKPNENAEIIKMIFDMYVNQNMGTGMIAERLNQLGYKTYTGKSFERSCISFILKNPCYIGKVTWKKKEYKKSKVEGKLKDCRTRDKSEWIIADGKHKGIISEDTFNKAQEIINGKYHVPYQLTNPPANPLAGVVICKVCGSKMIMRKYGDKAPHLICLKKCGNKSTRFDYVEKEVIEALESYYDNQDLKIEKLEKKKNIKLYTKQIETLKKELDELYEQMTSIHDLLEKHIYTIEKFIERSNIISEKEQKIKNQIENINNLIKIETEALDTEAKIKEIKKVATLYKAATDIAYKNALLKSVIDKIIYYKGKDQRNDNFEIEIIPRL